MSDVLAELEALTKPKPPTQCRTCRAIEELPALRESIAKALANGATIVDMSRVLRNRGYDISRDALENHLKNRDHS